MNGDKKCICGHEKNRHMPVTRPDGLICLGVNHPVTEGAPYTPCTCTRFQESTEPDLATEFERLATLCPFPEFCAAPSHKGTHCPKLKDFCSFCEYNKEHEVMGEYPLEYHQRACRILADEGGCNCKRYKSVMAIAMDRKVSEGVQATEMKREDGLIRHRLQTILDKPLCSDMLEQLEHAAYTAREFLFVSGDQDGPKIDAEFESPSAPSMIPESLQEISNAFIELLRALGKQEAFEEMVKDIVEKFKIVMELKE